VQYPLVIALFHVFPLPMYGGFRKSFAFAGELVDRGWSVLIFPEGELTPDGAIAPFRAGIGLLATRLRIPVVTVRLEGLYDLRVANKHWTSAGHIRVTIGAPVEFRETDAPEEIARELERHVKMLEENRESNCWNWRGGLQLLGGRRRRASQPRRDSRFSSVSEPPWASAICRLRTSPMPEPLGLVVKNGTNKLVGLGMPGPSSCTHTST